MGRTLFPLFKKVPLQLKCISSKYMQTQFIHPQNGVLICQFQFIPFLCITHMFHRHLFGETLNLFILLLPAIYLSQSEACVKSLCNRNQQVKP